MMSKAQKGFGLNLFLSFYFLFFTGWLQFHHEHEAVDCLNLGDSASREVVLGPHCHSSDTILPLFENHKIIIKHRVDCLLCTSTDWIFLRPLGNGVVCILKVQNLEKLPSEFIFHKRASSTYRLRAPPLLFPSS